MMSSSHCRLVLLAIVVVAGAGAFAPPSPHRRPPLPVTSSSSSSPLTSRFIGGVDIDDDDDVVVDSPSVSPSSRRALIGSMTRSAAMGALVVIGISSSIVLPPPPAYAIDTYLTEPTEEFKESERQRMEFRKVQLGLKADFVGILARLTTESSTESELIKDLVDLRELVIRTGGLPLGIKKEDMYKVIRSKKAKGYWPTNVEIA
jgi:hypothetical protein